MKTEADYIREHTARSKALKLEAWADAMVDEDPEVIRLRAKMWEVLDLLQSERKERTAKIQELTDKLAAERERCAKIVEDMLAGGAHCCLLADDGTVEDQHDCTCIRSTIPAAIRARRSN